MKIKISTQGDKFWEDLFDFLINKSYSFKRQIKLDQLLESNKNIKNIKKYLRSVSPIELESVYGSTYQSKFRSNEQIYAISHSIHLLEINNNGVIAHIKPNEYGEIIDFESGHLKPVYFKNIDDEYCIATFDIDFNITSET